MVEGIFGRFFHRVGGYFYRMKDTKQDAVVVVGQALTLQVYS
jgi:hypothetical protein